MQKRTKKIFKCRQDSYSTNPCFKIDFRSSTIKSKRKEVLHDIKAASRKHGERQRLGFTKEKSPPMPKRLMMESNNQPSHSITQKVRVNTPIIAGL